MHAVHLALEPLYRLLFVSRCALCDARQQHPLCAGCESAIDDLEGARCQRCDHPLPHGASCPDCVRLGQPAFERVFAAGLYRGTLKEAVLALKYRDGWRLAEMFARRLAIHIPQAVAFDRVAAVPIDRAREAARGYNQSGLIASRLAVRLGMRYSRNLLRRRVDGVVQSTASLAQRHAQVENIFEAGAKLEGLKILLVDDVMTTAATMHAAASALRARGARVWGAVVARQTMRNGETT